MPNVKSGTLVKQNELIETVTQAKQGLIEFRIKETSYIMSKIGNKNFADEDLQKNLHALMTAIAKKKPDSVKGKYFNKASIKTSHGPLVKLDVAKY